MSVPNTRHQPAEIAQALRGVKKLWFIGIGGVHMSALALLSRTRGFSVGGSDHTENENTTRLRRAGIPVYPQHDAAQMAGYDAVVYTLAITPDNPEYLAAQRLGLPLFSRADYLGYLMAEHPSRIGVAGTHGKSTVTAMLGEIFALAGRAPNILCGATMRRFDAPFFAGGGNDFIFEACEYGNSFLSFSPSLAVILNAELDHVDCFTDVLAVRDAFAAFAARASCVLLPAADQALIAAVRAKSQSIVTFGTGEEGHYRATDIRAEQEGFAFDLSTPRGGVGRITLRVPGRHNVENAVAAFAAASLSGIKETDCLTGLAAFRGAARRLEYRGIFCGARVFDDYAHHPTELRAALTAARSLVGSGRLFALFQSHTYSRTAAFFEEITAALRLADRVFIADIYPARECDTLGMSAARLAAGVGTRATYAGGFADTAAALARELLPGDLLLVMGAGDIDRIFAEFSRKHFTL